MRATALLATVFQLLTTITVLLAYPIAGSSSTVESISDASPYRDPILLEQQDATVLQVSESMRAGGFFSTAFGSLLDDTNVAPLPINGGNIGDLANRAAQGPLSRLVLRLSDTSRQLPLDELEAPSR